MHKKQRSINAIVPMKKGKEVVPTIASFSKLYSTIPYDPKEKRDVSLRKENKVEPKVTNDNKMMAIAR